ncbi:hypothetical protein PINS_up023545 [Pythium insidiosum]|nr:hypothetical protein PINS_up023545 [Pythium insidiosum]
MGSQEHETSSMADGLSPHEYLQRFWGAHASAFMRWFLALPYAGQVSLLRNASPDMPTDYDVTEPKPKASQLLTPELTLKALLEENGKVFLRLMNARARRSDDCSRHDLVYLTSLRAQDKMPTFSGDTFKNVSLAFIDPADPEQNVQSLLPSASQAILDEKRALIAQGRLIEADVWLTAPDAPAGHPDAAHERRSHVMMGEVTAAEIGWPVSAGPRLEREPRPVTVAMHCEGGHTTAAQGAPSRGLEEPQKLCKQIRQEKEREATTEASDWQSKTEAH